MCGQSFRENRHGHAAAGESGFMPTRGVHTNLCAGRGESPDSSQRVSPSRARPLSRRSMLRAVQRRAGPSVRSDMFSSGSRARTSIAAASCSFPVTMLRQVVHAVDEVDIRNAARTKHHRVARGHPAVGVAGGIVTAAVGFDFDDAPAQCNPRVAARQNHTQGVPGFLEHRTAPEFAGHFGLNSRSMNVMFLHWILLPRFASILCIG